MAPSTVILHRDARLTVRVCTPIGRIGDELVEGRIPWATPLDRPAIDPGRQVKLVLEEPKQRLPHTAKFGDLVDGERDRRLDTTVGILLQPVAHLNEANRRGDDEFTAPCLLIARRERALPQQIKLVLVEAALQPQEQPVIALSRRIDGLLIDEQCINDTAHLDKLLPIAAVACKARDLSSCHRTDLAEANFGDHAFEAGTRGSARCRTAKVLIDDFDLRPAKLHEAVTHGVLQYLALAVVLNLMSGGLADIEHSLTRPVLRADLVSAHRCSPSGGSSSSWRAPPACAISNG